MSIKVVSHNILAENCVDFKNPAEWYPGISPDTLRMSYRYPLITRRLLSYNADIILLQEMTYDIRDKIEADFPDYNVMPFAKHDLGDKKSDHYGNLTLLRKNIFTNPKHKTQYIHKSGTAFSTTDCKYVLSHVILCPKQLVIMLINRIIAKRACLSGFFKDFN